MALKRSEGPFDQIAAVVEYSRRALLPVLDRLDKVQQDFRQQWLPLVLAEARDASKFVAELITYDGAQEPLKLDDEDRFNRLQEFYFGLSTLVLGSALGQMFGAQMSVAASHLVPLHPLTEVCLLAAAPLLVSNLFRNSTEKDPAALRKPLHLIVLSWSLLLGVLIGRPLVKMQLQAALFVAPTMIALLIDSQVRHRRIYWVAASATTLFVTAVLLYATGSSSWCNRCGSLFLGLLHCFILLRHFEMTTRLPNDALFDVVKSQLRCFALLSATQVVLALTLAVFC